MKESEEFDSSCGPIRSNCMKNGVIINKKWFINYLKQQKFQTFTIITRKKEYKCNIFSIKVSKIIRDYIEKNPETNKFVYDIDDEFDEFQINLRYFQFQ